MTHTHLVAALLLFLVSAVPAGAQTFAATAVSPAQGAGNVSPASPITITFNEAVLATTITNKTVQVFGRWCGVVPGTLSVDTTGKQVTFQPTKPYFPGNMVSVSVTKDLKAKSNNTLATGFVSFFTVAVAPGKRTFTLVKTIVLIKKGENPIRTYGAHAGDVDGDSCPDIIAANEFAGDLRMLKNDGCGVFGSSVVVKATSQKVSPLESADFNGDGWMDIVSGNTNSNAISIYLGDGKGGLNAGVNYANKSFTHGVAVLDANGDGYPDVAAANRSKVGIFLNDGTGKLKTPTYYSAGSGPDNVAAVDANKDGKVDLFVGNYNGETVSCLLGDGKGGFKLGGSRSCGGQAFSIAVGDFDGDGNIDAATANWRTSTLGLVRGDGKGGFLAGTTTHSVGKWPVAVDLGDLDGDGHLDCVMSSFTVTDTVIFWNDTKGVFKTSSKLKVSKASSCATLVDFDRDGDLDIIATDELADELRLYAHDSATTTGVQPRSCGATLRINNLAGSAGFGTAAALSLKLGRIGFLGVSGPKSSPFFVGVGGSKSPGVAIPQGLLNVSPILLVIGGTTDANGDSVTSVLVPAAAKPGLNVTLQALTTAGLTNPETVVLVK